jgi:hypothetical protein
MNTISPHSRSRANTRDTYYATVSALLGANDHRHTYQKIAKAMLYCVPVMLRSGKRPSIFALPTTISDALDSVRQTIRK